MEVFTIGFTKSSAANFFGRLKTAGVTRLVDVRLANSSQLAAFAKQDDLRYFLRELCGAEYVHEPLLAPTQEILDRYKKRKGAWPEYEREFLDLMADRQIETKLDPALFSGRTVLLCSEPTATHCHRRLVLEYLQRFWDGMRMTHL
jgi:uncharacterized protein (DUF488 family)